MTRLIPTRDRAQATRFSHKHASEIAGQLLLEYSISVNLEPLTDGDFLVRVFPNIDGASAAAKFWSGPWYVREVAE